MTSLYCARAALACALEAPCGRISKRGRVGSKQTDHFHELSYLFLHLGPLMYYMVLIMNCGWWMFRADSRLNWTVHVETGPTAEHQLPSGLAQFNTLIVTTMIPQSFGPFIAMACLVGFAKCSGPQATFGADNLIKVPVELAVMR